MAKPLLIVVTGRPASGKTTLSRILARETRCPLISRDEMKEGYINTDCAYDVGPPDTATQHIYNTFFETIGLLLSRNISIVAEAAFQHKLWHPHLTSLSATTDIRIIVCDISPELARTRFIARIKADAGREKFHGDGAELLQHPDDSLLTSYKAPDMPIPTLHVDTTENYNPAVAEMIKFIRQGRKLTS
ncbi:MAG TPA: AAA family ATPase [Puia sp.]|nr:AAA family ATPase [Puia sp.]